MSPINWAQAKAQGGFIEEMGQSRYFWQRTGIVLNGKYRDRKDPKRAPWAKWGNMMILSILSVLIHTLQNKETGTRTFLTGFLYLADVDLYLDFPGPTPQKFGERQA